MSTDPAPPDPQQRPSTSPWQVASTIAGGLLALVGIVLVLGGGALAIAYATARDDDGYFTSPTERLATATPAITGEGLQLGDVHGRAGDWVIDGLDLRARIRATASGDEAIFVGIAREADVDAYLAGVAHDEITDVRGTDVAYRRTAGADRAPAPGGEDFWVASTTGTGTQEVKWSAGQGRWAAVVMRADGTAGVIADVSVGGRSGAILWIALVVLAFGLLVLIAAGMLIWLGLRSPGPSAPVPPADATTAAGDPQR